MDSSNRGYRQDASQMPRRRKSPKGEVRREAILSAAMKRFADDGYQSASFAAIAEDVGLSLPGLLHYFPSKVHLLLAILDKRDMDSATLIGAMPLHWKAYLNGLVEITRMNTSMAGVVRTFAILNAESLTLDHPAAAWFSERARTLREQLARSFREGIDEGEVRADVKPDCLSAEIIGFMDGLQMLWLRDPQGVDMLRVLSDYVERLIRDVGVTAASS
ncbi:TetR/AcrR family transcriptional regulator [Rhizobium oryzicola]|uniref:TetR/AcrR family transcriptional regulator n=1 Tax=Rhizobium oryzicola TaxID=1232668 RepID=A0ABT8T3A5_9HYPH|nr:TetR/AcrR family transcriptional regulator [Rhizobium oryzicola]MDO1585239.1 TetR/AcrR family transcriptional regulator [Rhizobium oryzicola]